MMYCFNNGPQSLRGETCGSNQVGGGWFPSELSIVNEMIFKASCHIN